MRHSTARSSQASLITERSAPRSVDEAFGVIRDAIAALANVETLLRSPKIGPKALHAVVPGLRDQRDPVTVAIEILVAHISKTEGARPAVEALFGFIFESRQRFARALDRAALGLYTARERLAFQAEVERMLAELRTEQELAELLLAVTEVQATEIDLREAIEHAFFTSKRSAGLHTPAISAVLALPDAPCTLHASPAVLMPLITLSVGLVHRATGAKPSLAAECHPNGSISLVVSDAPAEGDWLSLKPLELIPPVVPCAEVAARLGGGEILIAPDERQVVLRWGC